MILELFRQFKSSGKEHISIGWSGGNTMRDVAAKLASCLRSSQEGLPSTISWHALVSGLDVDTPATSRNAFFLYFDDPLVQDQIESSFVTFHAPPLVQAGQLEEFLKLPRLNEVVGRAADLNIIVTSAGSYEDIHVIWRRAYDSVAKTSGTKARNDCLGDMLWMPFSDKRPIEVSAYPYQVATLLPLQNVPEYIEKRTKVVLTIGPCRSCGRPKDDILKAILDYSLRERPLLSHLVVHSSAARTVLNK